MGGIKTKINLEQLRKELRQLNSRKELYRVLKEELTKLNWWKNRKRGRPNYNFGKLKER